MKRVPGPVFVTYCSKNKDARRPLLPAAERYKSERIAQVRGAAEALGVGFRILSGKFGLVAVADKIPYYDHLLKWEGIGGLLPVVRRKLVRDKITAVVYFTRPLRKASAPLAYHALIEAACAAAGVPMLVIELEPRKK